MSEYCPEKQNHEVSIQFQLAASDCSSAKKKSPKGHRITLRLTDEEFSRLTTMAQGKAVSAYIRACIFGSDSAVRKIRARTALKNETALAQVLSNLGNSEIAKNLGELATYAREGSLLLDEVTQSQIYDSYEAVMSMRGHLLSALGLIQARDK